MWESLKTRATDFTAGGRFKRRGAKLGILIAIMMTLPGLVAAYSFVQGSNQGKLTAITTNSPGADCGFVTLQASGDSNYLTLTSSGSALTTGTIYQAVSGSLNALETGGTSGTGNGYEYLTDQVGFECDYSTGTTVKFNLQVCAYGQGESNSGGTPACTGTASQVTGADWVNVEVTNVAPSSTNPAGTTGTASQECLSTPAPWYSSVANSGTASTWTTPPDYVFALSTSTPEWQALGTTTSGGCIAGPSAASPNSPLSGITYSAASGSVMEWIGLDIVDESSSTGLEVSGSPIASGATLFTLGFTASVS